MASVAFRALWYLPQRHHLPPWPLGTTAQAVKAETPQTPERNRKWHRLWGMNSPVLRLHTINKPWGAWRLRVRQTTFTLGASAALCCWGCDQAGCKFWWSMHTYLITGKSKYRSGRDSLCSIQNDLLGTGVQVLRISDIRLFFFLRGWAASDWKKLDRPRGLCSDTEEKDGRTFFFECRISVCYNCFCPTN